MRLLFRSLLERVVMVVVVGWGGDLLKIGRPGSRGWKKFGRRRTEEVGGLPN